MSTRRSRAHYLGVKATVIDRRSRRRLAKVNELLLEVAGEWGDVDNRVVIEIDYVVENLAELDRMVGEAVRYLKEPREGGGE